MFRSRQPVSFIRAFPSDIHRYTHIYLSPALPQFISTLPTPSQMPVIETLNAHIPVNKGFPQSQRQTQIVGWSSHRPTWSPIGAQAKSMWANCLLEPIPPLCPMATGHPSHHSPSAHLAAWTRHTLDLTFCGTYVLRCSGLLGPSNLAGRATRVRCLRSRQSASCGSVKGQGSREPVVLLLGTVIGSQPCSHGQPDPARIYGWVSW